MSSQPDGCVWLFPGQGAQTVGMGKDIAEAFPAAAAIFAKADTILGFDLSRLCFEGPAERLNTTEISQPAIFTVSAAILEVLSGSPSFAELVPDVTAGLSLGEYTALYAAGVIDFKQALLLVAERGRAMQQAAEQNPGAMVSIIGLDDDKIRQLCEQARGSELLEPVNFNCPGQVVVSGSISACRRAEELAEQLGAIKAVRLEVAGAFHTRMMASAAEALRKALRRCRFNEPGGVKVIANVNADYYRSAEQVRESLALQLTSPIFWRRSMERLIAEGFRRFYEIGPGRVLTGLMKRIDRKTPVVNISTAEALQRLIASGKS